MAQTINIQKVKAVQIMPTVSSQDKDWIAWSDFVIDNYGSTLGKQIFINAWQKRGSRTANSVAIRKHLKNKYDIVIDESVWDSILDTGDSISDGFAKVMKVGKITTYVVIGIVGVTIVGIAYSLIKNPSNALLATPQGRMAKMMGGLNK